MAWIEDGSMTMMTMTLITSWNATTMALTEG